METFAVLTPFIVLILGAPITVFVNILSHRLRDRYARTSTPRTQKRIKELEDDLKELEELSASPEERMARGMGTMLLVLVAFALASALPALVGIPFATILELAGDDVNFDLIDNISFGVYIVQGVAASGLYLFGMMLGWGAYRRLTKASALEETKEQLIADIERLNAAVRAATGST